MWKKAISLTAACLVALYSFAVYPYHSAAQGAAPAAKSGYEDFTSWYEHTAKLKALPFRAAALIDATTGQALYFHQESTVMPTASLMKLITAGTVLRFPRDWYTPVQLTQEDDEGTLRPYVGPKDKFSLLKLDLDDHITLEQAFASMLIGSANNAAVAMAHILGFTRENFIREMRVTAQQWGLKHTTIDEPSGLSLADTSTAEDIAHAACNVFSNFMASYYGSSPSVSFTTAKGVKKTVLHTVHDLRANPGTYFGAKTGYLTETQYHVAAGIITPQGHRLCAAVLTSPTRAESESTLRAMSAWADQMYRW